MQNMWMTGINNNAFDQGVAAGQNPLIPSFSNALIQQGLQNSNNLGMSAAGQYQPMNNYANPGTIMGLLNNAANTPQQNYRQQSPYYQNAYVAGLLGGV